MTGEGEKPRAFRVRPGTEAFQKWLKESRIAIECKVSGLIECETYDEMKEMLLTVYPNKNENPISIFIEKSVTPYHIEGKSQLRKDIDSLPASFSTVAGRVANGAWWFIKELRVGDYVVIPYKGKIHSARVKSEARFKEGKSGGEHVYWREVAWERKEIGEILDMVDPFIRFSVFLPFALVRLPAQKLVFSIIKSGEYLLVGSQAAKAYTDPHYTEDADFLVEGRTFNRALEWLKDNQVEYERFDEAFVEIPSLRVDLINADCNPLTKAVLYEMPSSEYDGFRIPCIEGLAILKYLATKGSHISRLQIYQSAWFIMLITEGCDTSRIKSAFRKYMPSEAPVVEKIIDKIEKGESLPIYLDGRLAAE